MAKLPAAFDSNQHDDMANFDPVPPGIYNVHITDSDYLETKNKDGHFLKLEFTVLDGDYQGRKIWTQLNLDNPNTVAMEIANQELATICRVCSKPIVQDSQELHGIPLMIKVKVNPAKGKYAPSNSPTGYAQMGVGFEKSGNSGEGAQESGKQVTGDATPTTQKDGVPWNKSK
ncbi:MAG: DUF669 domain-containing protein [bacterium]|nr:DUF669 domain-containing protein [bacterium]